MKKDEKERTLTAAEQKRLQRFEEISAELEQKGYNRNVLTIDLKRANIILTAVSIPFFIVSILLFWYINGSYISGVRKTNLPVFIVVLLTLTVIHELVHGLTWSRFSENGWKDIEFGIIWRSLTPYCTCAAPLEKPFYIMGALMPLIVLGIIPFITGLFAASLWVFFIGAVMILAAGGDIMLVRKLLKFRTDSEEILIYDHPTEAGSVVFTK